MQRAQDQRIRAILFEYIRISKGNDAAIAQQRELALNLEVHIRATQSIQRSDLNKSGRDYTKQPGLVDILSQIAARIRDGVAPESIVFAFCETDRLTRDRRFIAHVRATLHLQQIRWFNASKNEFITLDELLTGLDDAAKHFELQSAAAKDRHRRRRQNTVHRAMIGYGTRPNERRTIVHYARMYYRMLLRTGSNVTPAFIATLCIDHLNRHGHRFRKGDILYTFTPDSFQTLLKKYKKHVTNEELPCECENCPRPEIIDPEMVQCDTCEGFFHIGCGGARRAHLNDGTPYVCLGCAIDDLADVADARVVIHDRDPMEQ